MVGANVFQLLGTAIIPIVVFTSVASLNDGLFLIGCSVTTIMVFAFLFRNKGIHLAAITFHHSKKIIIYGIERVPSFVAQFILLAGVPIYLAQKVNFESVAYFNSSLSLVRLALLIVNPIGMVLLPRISNKIATGSVDEVNNMLNILFKAGLFLSVIGTIYCYINAPLILNFWLGTVNVSGVNILRLTILALPFYTFAGLSRSPIDAVSEKGYNSLIYSLAAIVMIAIIFIGKIFDCDFLETALTSFLISHIIAGLASAYFIQRLYKSKLWNFKIMRDIVGGVLIVYLINHLLSFAEISGLSQLIIGSAIYLVIGVIVFKFVKSGWIADLKTIMYAR
jgi:O-antigen/teichoic acid export membrane protein